MVSCGLSCAKVIKNARFNVLLREVSNNAYLKKNKEINNILVFELNVIVREP